MSFLHLRRWKMKEKNWVRKFSFFDINFLSFLCFDNELLFFFFFAVFVVKGQMIWRWYEISKTAAESFHFILHGWMRKHASSSSFLAQWIFAWFTFSKKFTLLFVFWLLSTRYCCNNVVSWWKFKIFLRHFSVSDRFILSTFFLQEGISFSVLNLKFFWFSFTLNWTLNKGRQVRGNMAWMRNLEMDMKYNEVEKI